MLQLLWSWLADMATIGSFATVVGLELGTLAGYYGHNAFTFAHIRRQGVTHRAGLSRFHAIAGYGWIIQGSVTALTTRPLHIESRLTTTVPLDPEGPVATLLRSLEPAVESGYLIGLVVSSVATYHLSRHLVWGSATEVTAFG